MRHDVIDIVLNRRCDDCELDPVNCIEAGYCACYEVEDED